MWPTRWLVSELLHGVYGCRVQLKSRLQESIFSCNEGVNPGLSVHKTYLLLSGLLVLIVVVSNKWLTHANKTSKFAVLCKKNCTELIYQQMCYFFIFSLNTKDELFTRADFMHLLCLLVGRHHDAAPGVLGALLAELRGVTVRASCTFRLMEQAPGIGCGGNCFAHSLC